MPGRLQVFHLSESSIRHLLFHGVKLLLRILLSLVRDVGVVEGSLVTASTKSLSVKEYHVNVSRLTYTLLGFLLLSSEPEADSKLPDSRTSRECCLLSSEVLGLLRLALWPPATFPGLDMLIELVGVWFVKWSDIGVMS